MVMAHLLPALQVRRGAVLCSSRLGSSKTVCRVLLTYARQAVDRVSTGFFSGVRCVGINVNRRCGIRPCVEKKNGERFHEMGKGDGQGISR